jgi:hypothetical protein
MARMALTSVMTTFFACLALDIAVPAMVLVTMVAASQLVFLVGDALAGEGRTA